MTSKEFKEKFKALQRECNDKQWELCKQYAIEHNPVKVGDIVTDHYHTIRVENISVYGHPIPYMRYSGIAMTKKGVPAKRQPCPREPVFQIDVKIINGKPYKYEED